MPIKNSSVPTPALQFWKQISQETRAASWFTHDGWEVLLPLIDHGKKTDLVIADDINFYRIQVKSVESSDDNIFVENKWDDANIDYVIYFSRTDNWGYITEPFKEPRKKLNSECHVKFHQHPTNFLKAFKKI